MSDDPAPSPSIPDPSGEPVLTVERLIRRYEDRIHEAVTGDPGQVRWAIYTSVVADLRALAAARPTSLPEALEPDEDGDNRCAGCGVPHRDGWWTAYGDDDAHWFMRQGEQLRWRETSGSSAATPSAPPVAVDPEALRWTDGDLLAAIGSALEVPTGMGETALLWEVYKPEGVAVALRQRLKDAGVLASTERRALRLHDPVRPLRQQAMPPRHRSPLRLHPVQRSGPGPHLGFWWRRRRGGERWVRRPR